MTIFKDWNLYHISFAGEGIAEESRCRGNLSDMSRELFRPQYRQISRKNGWTCPPHPLQFVAWLFVLYFSFVNFTTLVPHLHPDAQAAVYAVSFINIDFTN